MGTKTIDSARPATEVEKNVRSINVHWQKAKDLIAKVIGLEKFSSKKVEVKGEEILTGSIARRDPEAYFEEVTGLTLEDARYLYDSTNYFEDFKQALLFSDEQPFFDYDTAEEIARYYWDKFSHEYYDTN